MRRLHLVVCLLALAPAAAAFGRAPGDARPRVGPVRAEPAAPRTGAALEARFGVTLHDGRGQPIRSLEAGAACTLVFELATGGPAPAASGLRFVWPLVHAYAGFSAPQSTDPRRDGFVSLEPVNAGVSLRLLDPVLQRDLWNGPRFFDVRWPAGAPPPPKLRVLFRGRAPALALHPSEVGYKPLEVFVLTATGAMGERVGAFFPAIESGPAARLRVVGPAISRPGEPFELLVVGLDALGNPLPRDSEQPAVADPDGADSSRARARPVSAWPALAAWRVGPIDLAEDGRAHRLLVRAGRITGRSNPILARAAGPRLFFGDLHLHTGEVSNDAVGSMEGCYRRARHLAGLDFAGKTEHDEMTPDQWRRSGELVRAYDAPGRFVPFFGFEWSPAFTFGHRSVVLPGLRGPAALSLASVRKTEDLYAYVRPYGALLVPHLPSAEPVEHHRIDWSHHDDRDEPVVEIFSQWSDLNARLQATTSEENPSGVQAALLQGHRMGFVGGSDNHAARPGETGGLAAVWAPALERDAIISALRTRRCFATSGQRTIVEFGLAGAPAGSAVALPGREVALEATIHAESAVTSVEILRGVRGDTPPLVPRATLPGNGRPDLRVTWKDPEPAADAFYYLRIHESDGRVTWSSPVWCSLPVAPPPRTRPAPPAAAHAAWTTLPLTWTGTTLLDPSPNRLRVVTAPDGSLTLRSSVVEPPPRDGTRDGLFFLAKSQPVRLTGLTRLEFSLASDEPVAVTCLALDAEGVNAGFFRGLLLPGGGAARQLEQEFQSRSGAGPVTFWLALGARENRFRLSKVRLLTRP